MRTMLFIVTPNFGDILYSHQYSRKENGE